MESVMEGLFKVLGAVLGVFLFFVLATAALYFVVYVCIFVFVKGALA